MEMKAPAPNEAQKQYDLLTTAALGILYGDMSKDMVLQKLSGGKDNMPETIAHTAQNVLKSVVGGIESKGRQVPEEVQTGARQEIVGELIEIAMAAKLIPDEAQGKEVAKAALEMAMQPEKQPGAPEEQPLPRQSPQGQPPQGGGVIQSAMMAGA